MAKRLTQVPTEAEIAELERRAAEESAAALEQVTDEIAAAVIDSEVEEVMVDRESKDPRVLAANAEDDPFNRLRRSKVNIPAPLQPSHGTEDLSARAALNLAKLSRAKEAEQNKLDTRDWSQFVSFVRCTDSGCRGPGIWIRGDPRLPLDSRNWFSSYKSEGSYWPPSTQPYCQCCFAQGEQIRPLRVDFISVGPPGPEQRHVGLIANRRFVETITLEQFEALTNQPA